MKDHQPSNNKNIQSYPIVPPPCQEHFRLFSYLAMAILTIAIFVGLFLMLQHLKDEAVSENTIAAQESVLKNQELLLSLNENQTNALNVSIATDRNLIQDIQISMKNQENIIKLINITNRDNAEFFAILENMTKDLDKIKEYLEID